MKVCNKCGKEKPKTEFNKKVDGKDGLRPYCKECSKAEFKKLYQKDAKKYIDKSTTYKNNVRTLLREFKNTLHCEVCGESHPACLDFHHKDPSTKEFNVSSMATGNSFAKILEEIKKCQVLCANCHRKEHYKLNTIVNIEEDKADA